MGDIYRDYHGRFVSGAPWQYKKDHAPTRGLDAERNKLCWEIMDWLQENIIEPDLVENEFNHDIVQIWFMIMNFGYSNTHPVENPENDNRIVRFFSYIQDYMPEEMRNREMYKYRQSDKRLSETFEHWFFECKQKLQNYLTQQYFVKGRMKDLEILKRRYKENWSESKVVGLTADANMKVDKDSKLEIKIVDA